MRVLLHFFYLDCFRCNGLVSPASIDRIIKSRSLEQTNYAKLVNLSGKDVYNNVDKNPGNTGFIRNSLAMPISSTIPYETKVKIEYDDQGSDNSFVGRSIIGRFISFFIYI